MKERRGWIKKAYAIKSKQDIQHVYRGWADTYDADLTGDYGYVAPEIASKVFAEYVTDPNAHILDAGCGTGLVGEELQKSGFTDVTGVDISEPMLEKAAAKSIYTALHAVDLTLPETVLEGAPFDAAISVGVFAMGHLGPDALPKILRFIKSGGIFCFTINGLVFEDKAYEAHLDALETSGAVKIETLQHTDYIRETGTDGYVAVLKVQ